jgi:hypothetical protein
MPIRDATAAHDERARRYFQRRREPVRYSPYPMSDAVDVTAWYARK